jgi:hypothetical protein
MDPLVVAFVALAVAALALAARAPRRPRRMLSERTRRTLVVHRYGAPSVRGLLVAEHDDGLVLRRGEVLLEPDHRGDQQPEPVQLAGELLVRWDVIEDVQDLSATAPEVRGAGWRRPVARPAPGSRPTGLPSAPIAAAFARAPTDPRPRRAAG